MTDNIDNIVHRRCDHWSYFSRPDQTPHPHQAHCYLYTSQQCSDLRWEVPHMINMSKHNMERYKRYLHSLSLQIRGGRVALDHGPCLHHLHVSPPATCHRARDPRELLPSITPQSLVLVAPDDGPFGIVPWFYNEKIQLLWLLLT